MAHVGFEENIAYRVLNRASSMSRVTFQLVQPFPGCNIRLRYVFPLPSAHPFSQSFAHFEGFVVYSFRLSYFNYRTFAKFLPKFVLLKLYFERLVERNRNDWIKSIIWKSLRKQSSLIFDSIFIYVRFELRFLFSFSLHHRRIFGTKS